MSGAGPGGSQHPLAHCLMRPVVETKEPPCPSNTRSVRPTRRLSERRDRWHSSAEVLRPCRLGMRWRLRLPPRLNKSLSCNGPPAIEPLPASCNVRRWGPGRQPESATYNGTLTSETWRTCKTRVARRPNALWTEIVTSYANYKKSAEAKKIPRSITVQERITRFAAKYASKSAPLSLTQQRLSMLKVLSMDLEKDQQHFMNERVGLPPDYIKELSVGALFAISKVDTRLGKGRSVGRR